jgi:uncharacterized membrane protein YccC
MVVVLGVAVLAVGAVAGFGAVLALRSKKTYADTNEVVPGITSSAPASWAGAHTPEAKLHRRLGAAVRAAQSNPRFTRFGLSEQINHVTSAALAIDERLIAAAVLPEPHRAAALADVEQQVAGLEGVVASLARSPSVDYSKALLEQSMSEADLTLEVLARARAEVDEIERAAFSPPSPPPDPSLADTPSPDTSAGLEPSDRSGEDELGTTTP